MMTTLVETLQECLEGQPALRSSAQLKLAQFQQSPEYSLQLLNIIVGDQPAEVRVLATVNLKNYIDHDNWQSFSAELKQELTFKLVRLLGNPTRSIRFNIVIFLIGVDYSKSSAFSLAGRIPKFY